MELNLNNELPGYSLKEILFTNAITKVQRALRDQDGCPVIIKSFEIAYPSQRQRQCFLLSYELLRKFEHQNITKALDYFERDGLPVMVLEDKQSIDLCQHAKQVSDQSFPVDAFLNIAIQLADALSVIHHAQVIHKDLHPGNILINPESGVVQVSDFGLASLLSREQTALAPPDQLEGVLAYISPEQTGRMNRALDYRTDFYTLGVTFYELLSGQQPFSADDALGMVHAHIAKAHTPLVKCRADIPPMLSKLIDKLLHKMAEQRYQSALGLKKDLEKCRDILATDHPDTKFQLGKGDISDRFHVPQILYGREPEIKAMVQCFQQAVLGNSQLLSISGFSGVGKSALVHEVHQSIAAHRGLFISGKFDQFQTNTPYSALKQIFKSWLFYALSQSEKDLQSMRQELNDELGENARLLIDFMEEFTPLLGELPEVPALRAQESLNRFNMVFQQFVILISQGRPLVIFIDDLQWADRGTLNLLPMLLEEESSRILLIVAYRDNEVDENHPALQTLNTIKRQKAKKITSLAIQPLSIEHTEQLLVDSLHRSHIELRPLAELIQLKTDGNPFFINEFLKTLYNESLLNFDLTLHRWVWDVQTINRKDITDNVVELMLGKMQQLPLETQKVMQLAACVGSNFDFQMLAIISQSSIEVVSQQLWPAIKEGLILQEGGDWLLGTQSDPKEGSSSNLVLPSNCKFLHDRMLEAAYHSLADSKKRVAHLTIGRLLRDTFIYENELISSAILFSVVEQLNHAHPLITEPSERIQLASLNLKAAQRAKSSSVWEVALNYAVEGVALLPEDAWLNHYELCYGLYLVRIECEYLNCQVALGNQLSEIALSNAHGDFEKAAICRLLLVHNISDNGNGIKWAIEQGFRGLRFCGLDVPELDQINGEFVDKEEARLVSKLQVLDLERVISKAKNAATAERQLQCLLLTRLSGYSQVAGDYQLLRYCINLAMRLVLDGEAGQHTITIFGMYSILRAKHKYYLEADKFSKAAVQLVEFYPQSPDLSLFYNGLGAMQWFYTSPFSQACDFLNKSHDLSLVSGEILGGLIGGLSNSVINLFVMGQRLETLSERLVRIHGLLRKHQLKIAAGGLYSYLVDALMQVPSLNRPLPNPLGESAFSSDEWQLIQSCVMKPFIEHLQLQWFFWSEQYDLAWQSVKAAEPSLELMSGFITPLEHRFIAALLACQKYPDAPEKERLELVGYIECSMDELETLTKLCPENFEHKLHLLRAEQSRALSHDMSLVLAYYEQAIQSTKAGGYLQYLALANELCARYWVAQGFDTAARRYLQQAIYVYRQWGGLLKCSLLQHQYDGLLMNSAVSSETRQFDTNYSETTTFGEGVSLRDQSESQTMLNVESVMEASQQISSELNLRKLLIKSLRLIAEISGAQTAALVMNGKKGAVVETILSGSTKPAKAQRLDDCEEVPVSVINHVLDKKMKFDLSRQDELSRVDKQRLREDPYIKSCRPKAMLCIPINYRDRIIGALYLDSLSVKHHFSDEHLRVVGMLLSQAVISFENARLFGKSERINKTLEEKIVARTLALEDSNFELLAANEELKSFSYSVSHDLRAPLRSIKGFSEILIEEYSESLDGIGTSLLQRIIDSAGKMSELIHGLLELSRVQNAEIDLKPVNLSVMAQTIAQELNKEIPECPVLFKCAEYIVVPGDERMFYSVMENLLNNAWKYSSKVDHPAVEFGVKRLGAKTVYYVKDNGAGFDMTHAHNLFITFKRLHLEHEFSGTGVGLDTVKRIINKHAGEIWGESEIGKGAIFYFTLWTESL